MLRCGVNSNTNTMTEEQQSTPLESPTPLEASHVNVLVPTQDAEPLAEVASEIDVVAEVEEPSPTLTFHLLSETFAIMRFPPEIVKGMPEFIAESSFYTISRSPDEISIVCEERLVVRHADRYGLGNVAKISSNWRIMRLGVMDLSLTGVAARFTSVLAEREVNLNIIATYDTDYVMIPQAKLARAVKALREAGYTVE